MRTGRDRSRTINRHVRAVFELSNASNASQQSLAQAEASYKKLQSQYFQSDIKASDSRLMSRQDTSSQETGGLAEMVAADSDGRSSASSDLPTPGDSERSFAASFHDRFPSSTPATGPRSKSLPKEPSSYHKPSTPVSRNKLINQAIEDSKAYLVLSTEEVLRVKSDLIQLNARSESLNSKLRIETKVRDAALNLIRLHASNKKLAAQADEQLEQTNSKLDQVNRDLWDVAHQTWSSHRQLFQHTAAVLSIAATQPSYTDNQDMPTTLQDALTVINIKNQAIDILQTQQDACQCDQRDELKAQLHREKAKVQRLEEELREQRQAVPFESNDRDKQDLIHKVHTLERKLKSNSELKGLKLKLQAATEEADLLYKRNLDTNRVLGELFNALPDLEPDQESSSLNLSHPRPEDIYGTNPQFTLVQFSHKVDILIQENHDLIDKVLDLQSQLVNPTPHKPSQSPTTPTSPRFSLPEVEDLIGDLQSLLDLVESRAEALEQDLHLARTTHQQEQSQLQSRLTDFESELQTLNHELETKDLLCTKYQQILNNL